MGTRLATPLLVLGLALAGDTIAEPPPVPAHRAEYLLTRDGLAFADMVMELTLNGDGGYHYRAETTPHRALQLILHLFSEVSAGARVAEESSGSTAEGRFLPRQYRYERENDVVRSLTVTFDWEDGSADITSAERPWTMTVPRGTQDKLTVLLALRQDLPRGVTDLTYPVADGGRLKAYRYRNTGRAVIETALGRMETVTVTRTKDKGPVDYRLWLAPALDHLPVRVERTEGGAVYRMEISRVTEPGSRNAGGD